MEPWEGLDVDDSELSSFLLPSKRKALDPDPTPLPTPPSSDGALTLNPSPSSSIFRPCSQLYRPRDLSTPQLTSNSQTLASDSLSRLEASPRLPEQPNNSPRRIPGPAGALQAAMRRKDRNKELLMQGDDGAAPIPTQEYIRRAVENQDGDDSDFSLNPWVCAVDFVRREGLVSGDGAAIGTPLCAIRNGILADKVAQVVAIVKSCNSNGLGGLMVTLKDPTGSIGASIHRRVLNYGSFSKEISVGAVLILQKVAVFSPSQSVHYLNVTLNNVVKVISKHIGPLSEKICHVPTVKRASEEENNEKTCPSDARISHSRGRIDGIMSSFRRSANTPASRHKEQPCVVQAVDSYCNLLHREHSPSVEKEPVSTRSDADHHRSGEAEVDVQMTRANAGGVSVSSEVAKQGNNGGGYYTKENSGTSNVEQVSEDAEGGNMNSNEEQKTTGVSGSSLPEPEWTDQQLEELLEYD